MACKMSVQFVMLLVLAALAREQLAEGSKFAYTKPLHGKSNFLKEKRFKLRATSTTPTTTSTPTPTPTTTPTTTTTTASTEGAWPSSVEFIINSSPRTNSVTEPTDASGSSETSSISSSISSFTTSSTPSPLQSTTAAAAGAGAGVEHDLEPGSSISASNTITTTVTSTTPSSLVNTLPTPPTPTTPAPTTAAPTVPDNQPVPCTCGVFLSSQIRNGLPDKPLIHNEMDRMYPCNAIGRKQCQTKCLETIVQHLPNSANIVCATLGHNCHKERAYLFIKNCHNQWVNTNLQAGREYCCKDGTPYRCPLLG